jgi:FkbM family methyltransferase
MTFFRGLKRYHRTFGLSGLITVMAYRFSSNQKEIAGHPKGVPFPVYMRLRTSDVSAYEEVLLGGEYEFALPFSPTTIVDVGANIGMASIYFANRYPDAKIVAIEAEKSNFDLLYRNVHPYDNISPIHAALWNRDGEIAVTAPNPDRKGDYWAFTTHEGVGTMVRAVTMPTLLREAGLSSVDLLKIDIEGAEKEVFESCEWSQQIRCIMIELHDRLKPGCRDAVDAATRSFSRQERGYTTIYFRNNESATLPPNI